MLFPSGEKSYGLWRTLPFVSPGVCEEVEETIETLLFADRRRRIQTLVSRGIFKNNVITTGIKGESVFFSVLTSQFIRSDLHQYFPWFREQQPLGSLTDGICGSIATDAFLLPINRSVKIIYIALLKHYGILIKPLIVTF